MRMATTADHDSLHISVEAVGSGVVLVPALSVRRDTTVGELKLLLLRRAAAATTTITTVVDAVEPTAPPMAVALRLFAGHGGAELCGDERSLRLRRPGRRDAGANCGRGRARIIGGAVCEHGFTPGLAAVFRRPRGPDQLFRFLFIRSKRCVRARNARPAWCACSYKYARLCACVGRWAWVGVCVRVWVRARLDDHSRVLALLLASSVDHIPTQMIGLLKKLCEMTGARSCDAAPVDVPCQPRALPCWHAARAHLTFCELQRQLHSSHSHCRQQRTPSTDD
jgi:hypothetical protein